jgi:oligosaccharide repeat unit polymerase
VLNAYFKNDFEESKMIGETTFQPFYNFLAKLGVVDPVSYYDKGYFIPSWTNTGTYLRDLYGDFGVIGIFLIPFLIGLLASLFWYKFYEEAKIWQLLILAFIYVIIMFSFLMMYTRFANFYLIVISLLLLVPLLEKLASGHDYIDREY